MKVQMDFTPALGRLMLIVTAGSPEAAKIIEEAGDKEILEMCFRHSGKTWGFSNLQVVEEDERTPHRVN